MRIEIDISTGAVTEHEDVIVVPYIPTVEEIRASLLPLSAWQVRKVLRLFGLLETVKDAVSAADEETQEAWEYATEFKRDDAVLNGMAQIIGMSDIEVDQMFTIGITL